MPEDKAGGLRVAVMQPYFLPYAGYFRLFAATDVFVLFDCVQFPRRGRVHRTEVPLADGAAGWLTLPLAHQAREVTIADLAFAPGARAELDARMRRLPWIASARGPAADSVRRLLAGPLDDVVGFLESTLSGVAALLGMTPRIVRSSSLRLDPALRGQDRVIAAAKAMGAARYLNAPGGKALYDASAFEEAGLALEFLPPYRGPWVRMLPALLTADPIAIRDDVLAGSAGAESPP
jgi:hypothetical protein